ncbi:hypothetical protein LX15_005112 [Streptoalloteichus tenebrarius]|uniref:Glycoprotein n=1 Tax=Streptoalloteichus tenebrarius (strain ATCC 17920 / DSM 40477 / JCM 4838 / CBS 697.72 / NBRC 16177 / NCIMB 11028 / NRRL B-12390 / A12253. 1 / ISP 5477) TaxID=1933 RepID=A0ABT1I0W2_STRSD|nr:DUF6049 family protein [Streptoalloteichus tenebrarius]MCP2261386.1 hypothetical protein [Streptoalloteichus tenebrarius]BFF01989.1 DUF6049 family protein [Streptoalloteichus tenebrarius]
MTGPGPRRAWGRAWAALLTGVVAVLTTPFAAPAHGQQPDRGDDPARAVRVDVTSLSPQVVTASGPNKVTVTGRVTNTGNRRVENVEVKLQRGEALRTSDRLRDALRGSENTRYIDPAPQRVADGVDPGQSVEFTLEMKLRPIASDSLRVNEPGVYPVAVVVNGRPQRGGSAALDEARMLLPVTGLPDGGPNAGAGRPVPLTMLWPLVDRPRVVGTADDGRAVLGDDELATSFAQGGRLADLVRAVEQEAPAGSPLGNALCFAVDPDLLSTAEAMSRGYLVRRDRSGAEVDGSGANAAKSWLARLKEVVKGRCVLALPTADVDVVALSRAGLSEVTGKAVTEGARTVKDVLGVDPASKVVWPHDGVLDERAMSDLVSLGTTSVLLEPRGLQDTPAGSAPVRVAGGQASGGQAPLGLRIEPLFDSALDPVAQGSGQDGRATTAAQNALGVLVHRTTVARPDGPLVLAPPRRWGLPADALRGLLHTARDLVDGRFAEPTGLPQLATTTPDAGTAALTYPVDAGGQEVPPNVTARLTTIHNQVRDLLSAMKPDPANNNYLPGNLVSPIQLGVFRSVSTAWRGAPALAESWATNTADQLDDLREGVKVLGQATPYTLASSDSPLPLTIANTLPVTVHVQINILSAAGLRTQKLEVQQVSARTSRSLRIPTEVQRSGQFYVDVSVSTPGGTPLGQTTRLRVTSSAYGTITTAITAGAAVLLVALVARRLVRRVRAARAGATADQGVPVAHGTTGRPGDEGASES